MSSKQKETLKSLPLSTPTYSSSLNTEASSGYKSREAAAAARDDYMNRVPTGMSHMDSVRSGSPKEDDWNPVYIPPAFQKSRKEKMGDQNGVLSRLQGLM